MGSRIYVFSIRKDKIRYFSITESSSVDKIHDLFMFFGSKFCPTESTFYLITIFYPLGK